MKKRNESLDALRGFAILAMVLSGSIAYGDVLPAWMYHAQVPPPDHTFHPNIPGITWVDLVFPFFLFSMGAAFPLSLTKKLQQAAWYKMIWNILQRGLLLSFFALFTMHIRSYVNSDRNTAKDMLAIGSFVLIHLIFVQWPSYVSAKLAIGLKIIALVISVYILSQLTFKDGSGFKLTRIDIIIVVLSNMAIFGSAVWVLTKDNHRHRILILPFVIGIFLSGTIEGSWTQRIYQWTPIDGLYSFYYLKYLFIIIPGTIAGDWLMQYMKNQDQQNTNSLFIRSESLLFALLSWLLVIVNLVGLFGRYLLVNLFASIIIVLISFYVSKRITKKVGNDFYNKFITAGSYLLLLGLVFEAYQGGIKKDISTYSYYFVTSGLAFYVLCSFLLLESQHILMTPIKFFAKNGMNPMVAYVAGNLILIPLLNITGTNQLMETLNANAYTGFLKGIIFTGLVSLLTIFFVKQKFLWKT